MKKHILWFPIALMMLLSGCASNIPQADKERDHQAKNFSSKPNVARLYIFSSNNLAIEHDVIVNEIEAGKINEDTFSLLEIPPGIYTVSAHLAWDAPVGDELKTARPLEVNIEAGKVYFFKQMIPRWKWNPPPYTTQIDEDVGIKEISARKLVIVPSNVAQSIAAAKLRTQLAIIPSNFPSANKLMAPTPISGNSGNYMSPFTAAGSVAPWAMKVAATTDNGSDLAANVGGAVGEQVGRKALDFIPFGLGGMVGKEVGSQAGRSATRTTIQPKVPSAEEARATSDISFDTPNELAVFMYAKYSTHPEYVRVLGLTQQVYPELTRVYVSAIEQAAKSPEKVAQGSSKPEFKKTELKDKLEALKELKDKGLISESDYQVKKNKLIDAM